MDDPTRFWLAQDGDARIEIAAETGTNPYGCPPYPDPELLDFGSATASVISEAGYAAADRLRRSLGCTGKEPPATSRLLRETERIREELLVLLGIPPAAGIAALLTASGTDAIRLASMLVWNESERPPDILAVAPEESGRGVPDALSAPSGGRYCPIRVRDPQGRLRPPGRMPKGDRCLSSSPMSARPAWWFPGSRFWSRFGSMRKPPCGCWWTHVSCVSRATR